MPEPSIRRFAGQAILAAAIAVVLTALQAPSQARQTQPLRVEVSFPASVHAGALDGRLLLMLSPLVSAVLFDLGGTLFGYELLMMFLVYIRW